VSYFRRAIEIDKKALGNDHPDVGRGYNNLAHLLKDEGRYAEAEPLYRQAIEINEKTLGKDHPNSAIDYNNLARLLQAQGKYAQAEPLYRQAIEILQEKRRATFPCCFRKALASRAMQGGPSCGP
jgi:tetratricopeptide (TPR) repeat protein